MARAYMLKNIENATWYLHYQHAVTIQYAAIMSQNRG